MARPWKIEVGGAWGKEGRFHPSSLTVPMMYRCIVWMYPELDALHLLAPLHHCCVLCLHGSGCCDHGQGGDPMLCSCEEREIHVPSYRVHVISYIYYCSLRPEASY
jgi:hypothetical protein